MTSSMWCAVRGQASARVIAVGVALTAALLLASAHAHHSRAMFDTATVVHIRGTVASVSWRNPHVYIEVDAFGEATRETETWMLESGSVAGLVQEGWSENTIKLGDRVQVEVYPHKDSSRRYAALIAVTQSDGARYASFVPGAASAANAASAEASRDFTGTWNRADATNRGGAVGNEAVGGPAHWPLTARGRAQVEAFAVGDDPMFRCVFYGVPRLAASVYSRRWTRYSDRIVIEQEQYPITRTIYLDRRPMPADFEPSPIGFSEGTLEADGTLVVETTGFSHTPWGSSAGLDSSDQKRVVERYQLSADGLQLHYSHTLFDPEFLTAPVEESWVYSKIGDREYVYETCDVESARRPLQFSERAR